MRLTLSLLGYELDVTLGKAEAETRVGDALSTPVGFSVPVVPWDGTDSYHQFEPED